MGRSRKRYHPKPFFERHGWPHSPDGDFDLFGFCIDTCKELNAIRQQAALSDYIATTRVTLFLNKSEFDEPEDEIAERNKYTPESSRKGKRKKKH